MNQIVSGIQFNVGARYEVKKLLGDNVYGYVALAIDKKQNEKRVAIKKVHRVRDEIDAKRVLRKIRILRTMQHENILHLENLIYDDSNKEIEFGDIYLVTNYFEVDLYMVIKSGQNLTDQHYQYIIYQLLKGLKYLHSANIVHRDINPSIFQLLNIVKYAIVILNQQENQKNQKKKMKMKRVDATMCQIRYYKAPEIILQCHEYSTSMDIWSLGCIFAELITKKILFQGTNFCQTIKLIFDTLGKPQPDDLQFITNSTAKKFVDQLKTKQKCSIESIIKYSNPLAIDLLDKMLEINPKKRISSKDALNHPYFESIRDPDDEPSFEGNLDTKFENDKKMQLKDLKILILNELNLMKQLNNEPLINIQFEVEKREKIIQINQQKTQLLKQKQQKQQKQKKQ